ncbi:unnamed protein product [Caenorhabditis nigoni]
MKRVGGVTDRHFLDQTKDKTSRVQNQAYLETMSQRDGRDQVTSHEAPDVPFGKAPLSRSSSLVVATHSGPMTSPQSQRLRSPKQHLQRQHQKVEKANKTQRFELALARNKCMQRENSYNALYNVLKRTSQEAQQKVLNLERRLAAMYDKLVALLLDQFGASCVASTNN